MAFGERYLDSLQNKPRARKGLTLTLSISFHAAAIAFAIFWSFFHVEELPPPPVTVTFFGAAAPPPPPPPPPPPKKSTTPKIKPKDVVQPTTTPNEIVQPKEKEPEPNEDEGVEGGVEGGVPGGVVGGVLGGVPGGQLKKDPEPPKLLPPNVAESQKAYGPLPQYTQAAKLAGINGTIIAKICVTPTGGVQSVAILRGLPMLSDQVTTTVKGWRYKPFMFNGRAMPFCHVANFVFNLK